MCVGPFPSFPVVQGEPILLGQRMLTMRQNKNKIQTNCAWNGNRTKGIHWQPRAVSTHTYITDTCICMWVIWNLPKNRGRKLNYPKQQKQQQQQRDGYRSENKTIKGTQKRENKSWGKHRKKRKRNACKVKWKSASPEGISSWLLFLLLYLPCPAPCHINHISHATLCPLMSMPDICHGPWPMSYYLQNNPPPHSLHSKNRPRPLFISPSPPLPPVVYHSADLPRLK